MVPRPSRDSRLITHPLMLSGTEHPFSRGSVKTNKAICNWSLGAAPSVIVDVKECRMQHLKLARKLAVVTLLRIQLLPSPPPPLLLLRELYTVKYRTSKTNRMQNGFYFKGNINWDKYPTMHCGSDDDNNNNRTDDVRR